MSLQDINPEILICDSPNCSCTEEERCSDEASEVSEIRNAEGNTVELAPVEQAYILAFIQSYLTRITLLEVQAGMNDKQAAVLTRIREKLVEMADNAGIDFDDEDYVAMGIRSPLSVSALTEIATSTEHGFLSQIANYLLANRSL